MIFPEKPLCAEPNTTYDRGMGSRAPKTKTRKRLNGVAEIASALGITEAALQKRRGNGDYSDLIHRYPNGRIYAFADEVEAQRAFEQGEA